MEKNRGKESNGQGEEDHELVWLDIEDACDKLFLKNQSWAVEKASEIITQRS